MTNEGNDYNPNQYDPGQPQYPQQQPPYDPGQPAGQPQYPQQQPPYGSDQLADQPQYPQQQPPYDPGQPAGQPQYPQQQPPYGPDQFADQPQYPQQQPPYGPGQYGMYPPYGEPQPPKKKNGAPHIIIALVAVLAVVAAAFFLILNRGGNSPGVIGGIARSADPEKYLQAAAEQTSRNIEEAPSRYPDFSRFAENPFEQGISLEVINVVNAAELSGANADMTFKTDMASGKFLFDFSLGYNGINIKNNQLFFSKDLVALSMPDLYTRNKYVTVNPQTFAEDWNNSPFGAASPIDPAEFDAFSKYADSFSGSGYNAAITAAAEKALAEWQANAGAFFNASVFKDEGSESITVSGKTIAAAKLGYSLSSEESKAFYSSMLSSMRTFMDAYMEQLLDMGGLASGLSGYNPYQEMADQMDETFAELEKISFPNGFKVVYYVSEDSGLVNRISIQDMIMSHSDNPGEDVTMNVEIDMFGDKIVTDDFSLTMTAQDTAGQLVNLVLTNNTTRDDLVSDKIALYAEVDGEKVLDLKFDMSWDSKAQSDNLKIDIIFSADSQTMKFIISGNMTDSQNGINIKNGRLDIGFADQTIASLNFEYGIRSIDAAEVDIDQSQAADFFSLDLDQFYQDVVAGAMKLSMF